MTIKEGNKYVLRNGQIVMVINIMWNGNVTGRHLDNDRLYTWN